MKWNDIDRVELRKFLCTNYATLRCTKSMTLLSCYMCSLLRTHIRWQSHFISCKGFLQILKQSIFFGAAALWKEIEQGLKVRRTALTGKVERFSLPTRWIGLFLFKRISTCALLFTSTVSKNTMLHLFGYFCIFNQSTACFYIHFYVANLFICLCMVTLSDLIKFWGTWPGTLRQWLPAGVSWHVRVPFTILRDAAS